MLCNNVWQQPLTVLEAAGVNVTAMDFMTSTLWCEIFIKEKYIQMTRARLFREVRGTLQFVARPKTRNVRDHAKQY